MAHACRSHRAVGGLGLHCSSSAASRSRRLRSLRRGRGGAGCRQRGGGKDEGYGYEFSDDPLSAGGFGPNDATIRVRPGPVRTTLIRPRTSFVPEMLKSVENL